MCYPERPEDSLQTMIEWLKNCDMAHPKCKALSTEQKLPRRVIDVEAWHRYRHPVRLHETVDECAPYVALSHRWGANCLLKTTASTIESWKKGIRWGELSETFQDAITFTAELGLRYLWIDSLCIIQDSKGDWEAESSKMAAIYENAFVTLAANRPEDVSKGLFGARKAKSATLKVDLPGRPSTTIHVRKSVKHAQFYEGSTMSIRNSSYPLFERAWCFQERILATRILHFTRDEVVFECKTGCKCECTSIGLRGEPFIKAYYQDLFAGKYYVNSWIGWRTVVSDYSKNQLTSATDVLPALSGVSSRLQCAELGEFVAGLWGTEIIHGLFWYTTKSAPKTEVERTAPSFSWASLIGKAYFGNLQWTSFSTGSTGLEDPNYQVLGYKCAAPENNIYGEVAEGSYVELQARCHPVLLRHNPFGKHPELTIDYQPNSEGVYFAARSWVSTTTIALDCGAKHLITVEDEQLTCFIGFFDHADPHWVKGAGLLLKQKTPTMDTDDDDYVRVGYFEFRDPLYEKYAIVGSYDWKYGKSRRIKIF